MFKHLELHSWRQFAHVDIEFHPKLTVVTGANGTGKTTILNILTWHFEWSTPFLSTPVQDDQGVVSHASGVFGEPIKSARRNEIQVGTITYSEGSSTELSVTEKPSTHYELSYGQRIKQPGLFIPSHRPVYRYQSIDSLPTKLPEVKNYFAWSKSDSQNRAQGSGGSPTQHIKTALLSLALHGYGNQVSVPVVEAARQYEAFQNILKVVLPPALGFQRLQIVRAEVVLQTTTGDFLLDAVSGGIAAIIDLAWQIYWYSVGQDAFTVIIDEPENHLHPEITRRLLPSFMEVFPGIQFIAATHDPFIVGSVQDSSVYVLQYNDASKVEGCLLDPANRAGTSNEILRNALGLSFTMPLWVEEKVDDLVERFTEANVTEASLRSLKEEMSKLGLGHLFPDALNRVLEGQK